MLKQEHQNLPVHTLWMCSQDNDQLQVIIGA